jgi:hypothetical protein
MKMLMNNSALARFVILGSGFFLIEFCASAQIVPDLTTGDHYLPYLTEAQKQGRILKPLNKYPQTSEELYPQLYKYANQDYLGPVKGTSADPTKAFKSNGQIAQSPNIDSRSSQFQNQYEANRLHSQNQLAVYEADRAAIEAQKNSTTQVLEEFSKEFPTIFYNLGRHNGEKADRFIQAYSELEGMLSGTSKIDFARAVWLVERSADPTLSWDEFNGMLRTGVQIIQQLMVQDKLSPKDNLAKIMTIYKFMSDTTAVFLPAKETRVISKPMLYDFEDYKAEKDITKVFVSKLLRTGSGQCMSLPMLYFLFAKSLDAQVNLAFAPQHSYITFKDNLGNRQNVELTGKMFTTNDFYWQTGFIKSEQVKSGIYLRPASDKETVAYLLTTLALTYQKTFGSDERMMDMALTARNSFPQSLTANMLAAGYYIDLWKNIQRQYDLHGLSESQLGEDQNAQDVKQEKEAAVNFILKNLGWSKMPDWAYQKWLNSVNELANKRQHIVKRRQLENQLK